MRKLPPSVEDIAEVIGRQQALYLIGQLPRVYTPDPRSPDVMKTTVIMYVPQRLTPQDRLVSILGWDDAEKLVRSFRGMLIHPATCAEVYRAFRDENIARLNSEKVPNKMIAEWFGVTERHVRNVVATAANDNTVAEKQQTRRSG